ncbi:MAG: hypothetical protein EWV75_02350 [Microcystis wesenbergii Mw_QC_S_20081001_S30D]|uniref:Uncharacterized protein n=1 Tax=Microcystis wesenbergii Mw_QC_S_20081001_S30D TaxID=2486245 RepID=A0A552JYT0_9CHRO|nr:MAG: hypothetical protein EWV74_12290 [Microcystis wesenbergii Mw_QC_S_20081001_S30]TRV00861.1 MAG: hypothetical protein EWV75_02350 [Microcystis wesenbergii Mw_QC_S_20081001_S30D]TRV01882.1 MAG: hypothetical protein EWV73_08590 [Microcystis wesenbergii Mw_QC_B_20070930_S4D]TRV17018.1 MAG: hypothetical protein EWV89_03565 [Microcystis wesenbergii Mw_QC_B_20070930_S4]
MRIIFIYLRDSNTSSDSGIILHYAMVGFYDLFWTFKGLACLETTAKSRLSLLAKPNTFANYPFFP